MIRIIKKASTIIGLIKKRKIEKTFIKNVFNTSNELSVLISYITTPFTQDVQISHTNFQECYTAAKIFSELGYNVDVINFLSNEAINYSSYNAIYGFGDPIESYFISKHFPNLKSFIYLTGCYPVFSNDVSAKRVRDLYSRKKELALDSARIVDRFWLWNYYLSDTLIVLGNKFTVDTYAPLNHSNIKNLKAFFYKNHKIDISKKNFKEAASHFLWFGSSGAVHKGLDLLLEIFYKRKDITLHICGLKSEEKFHSIYKNELNATNIKNHGQVDIRSEEFANIMLKCGFCIFPSASEGGAVAVLTALGNGGLIPIISIATGLDLKNFGFILENVSLKNIDSVIDKTQDISEQVISDMAKNVHLHVNENYSYSSYKENLKTIIVKNLD